MKTLVTGAAGFIGFHVCRKLLGQGREVIGLDNLDAYYDINLKRDRLKELAKLPEAANFKFIKADIADAPALDEIFEGGQISHVAHLAAQAGVRHSLEKPQAYARANLGGFVNVLECCRHAGVKHLVYASSSSVYGLNAARPYSPRQNVDHPVSLYAATKKSDELMAHAYSHLFQLPATGLRFFTVYGPWGRPDMALYLFTDAILAGRPIKVFNHGNLRRDFTYVDDIAEGVARILDIPATPDPDFDPAAPDPSTSSAPWRVYNIGNSATVALKDFIGILEKALGRKAELEMLPMQAGDVESTWADVAALERVTGFKPATPLEEGVAKYIEWFKSYYGRG